MRRKNAQLLMTLCLMTLEQKLGALVEAVTKTPRCAEARMYRPLEEDDFVRPSRESEKNAET